MRLTAETFDELLRSLRSNPPAGTEMRRMPRVGLRVRAQIMLRDAAMGGFGGAQYEVGVRDVSGSGIGLTSPKPIAVGATFVLLLDGQTPKGVSCEAVHCRQLGSDLYRVGARFTDVDSKHAGKPVIAAARTGSR